MFPVMSQPMTGNFFHIAIYARATDLNSPKPSSIFSNHEIIS